MTLFGKKKVIYRNCYEEICMDDTYNCSNCMHNSKSPAVPYCSLHERYKHRRSSCRRWCGGKPKTR